MTLYLDGLQNTLRKNLERNKIETVIIMKEYKFKIHLSCGYDFDYTTHAESEEGAIKNIREIYPFAKLERIN